jgi:hypothetical protein
MQDPDHSEYFERRAEEERTAAEQATDERAAQSHRQLRSGTSARRRAELMMRKRAKPPIPACCPKTSGSFPRGKKEEREQEVRAPQGKEWFPPKRIPATAMPA